MIEPLYLNWGSVELEVELYDGCVEITIDPDVNDPYESCVYAELTKEQVVTLCDYLSNILNSERDQETGELEVVR